MLGQHQRELLHTLELETLRARTGPETGLPIALKGAGAALPSEGTTYAGVVAMMSRDLGKAPAPGRAGAEGKWEGEAQGAHRPEWSIGQSTIGQATLEQKMEGLRLTMQRYATVGQDMLGLEVEVARLKTIDAQNAAKIQVCVHQGRCAWLVLACAARLTRVCVCVCVCVCACVCVPGAGADQQLDQGVAAIRAGPQPGSRQRVRDRDHAAPTSSLRCFQPPLP